MSLGINLCVYVIFTDNSAFGKYNTEIEEKTRLLNSSRALHTKYPYQKYLLPKIVSLSLTYFIQHQINTAVERQKSIPLHGK